MQILTASTNTLRTMNKIITSSHHNNKAMTRRRSSTTKKIIIRPDSPSSEKDEPAFNIVYSAEKNQEMITPPSSPKSSPAAACFEANDRILSAKRNGQLKSVMNEYIALKKEGLLFTDHTYNLILDAYASLRSNGTPLTPMMKIYNEMIQSDIQPSSSTYAILIRTLCKRDVEVQKVLAMLKRQYARSSCIKSNNKAELESEANLTKALCMFHAAVSESLVQYFDPELYNQLLRVLSHYGNTIDSLKVYEQLEQHAMPTSATFAALINLFGRVGDLDSALVYFNKYDELKDHLGPHDASYVYNALVDAHLKCHELDGALKIVQQDMVANDVKMSTIPCNSIIRYYCIQNDLEAAKKLIQSMKESALVQPDASSYGPVLSSYCQLALYTEATEMYGALLKTDISKSYGNLANYALLCLKNNNHGRIMEVIKDMRHAGLEPDSVLGERIVTNFATLGQVSEAIQALAIILETMKPRTLAKGIAQIKNAGLQIALAAKGSFHSTVQVARLLTPHCPISVSLAKLLVENYEFDVKHDLMTESDYGILLDASLTIACDLSPANRHHNKSCLSPLNVFCFGVYDEMNDKKFKVSPSMKSRILSYFVRSGDKKAAQKWESLFSAAAAAEQQQEVKPATSESEEASVAVMKAAISGQLEESLDILRTRITDAGLLPTAEPLRDAIAFIGKQGHLETAVTMYRLVIKCFKDASSLDSQRTTDRAIYLMTNAILIGYAQQGDMVQAKKYYEQIKLMGRYPDGNGYASLLLGSAKCATDEATDALTIYDEAKRRDVKPTTFFYNVVISKLAKARKLEAAMKLFEEMQHFQVMPNSITYGAIISACVRAGSEPLATKLFADMLVSSSFQPRVGPFNNMIQFYVRQQPDRARALEYFAELRRRQIKPSAHTYKLLMEAYCVIAPYDMPTAHRMLTEMERRDCIRPQATHYATLIYSYGTLQRDVQSADRVFQDMEAKKVTKDEVVYQAMVDTLVSNDQLDRAEQLYQEMLPMKTSGCPYIENVIIRGYGEKGLVTKAKAMFDKMVDEEEQGVVVTIREPSTFEAMVRAYVENKQLKEAKEIFELMVQREFPEKVTALVAELISSSA